MVTLANGVQFSLTLLLHVGKFLFLGRDRFLLLFLQVSVFIGRTMVYWDGIQIDTYPEEASISSDFRRQSLGIEHLLLIHHLTDVVLPTRLVVRQPLIQRPFPTVEDVSYLRQFILQQAHLGTHRFLSAEKILFYLFAFHQAFLPHRFQTAAHDGQLAFQFMLLGKQIVDSLFASLCLFLHRMPILQFRQPLVGPVAIILQNSHAFIRLCQPFVIGFFDRLFPFVSQFGTIIPLCLKHVTLALAIFLQ